MDINYKIVLLFIGISYINGYDSLSKGKNSTILPSYQYCQPVCGQTTATDGNKDTCTNTEAIGPSSKSKTTSFSVDLGGTRSIYSISILYKEYTVYLLRQRGRFAGFSLYISDTPKKEDGHLCYKNILPLPPLEFSTTCIGYSRYVIFYNERLDGVTYPEGYETQIYTQLCEVDIKGCSDTGVYGSSCNLPCPKNCNEHKCNIVNGTCLGCIPGWTGDMCTEKCPWGWYGHACKSKCIGHCSGYQPCNHVTGQCQGGCASGWMGKLCYEPCVGGFYGPDCISYCSGHCLNNTHCSRETGHCDNGCSPGYIEKFCSKPCTPGIFGNTCQENCSKHCKYKKCDHISGTCINGCDDGFVGRQCFNTCEKGYYGTNCSSICTLNCNFSCHFIDGSCNEEEIESKELMVVEISVSVGVTVLAVTVIIVFVRFLRRKNSSKEKQSGDVYSGRKFYEDLNDLKQQNQYQEIHVDAPTTYENLSLKTM